LYASVASPPSWQASQISRWASVVGATRATGAASAKGS